VVIKGPEGLSKSRGNERGAYGQPGLTATAARGKAAPGDGLERSQEPEEMSGEREGKPGPFATAAAGKQPPTEAT
jgi:hypothetical protein